MRPLLFVGVLKTCPAGAARLCRLNKPMAYVSRPDGKIYYFESNNGQWLPKNAAIKDKLVQLKDASGTTGWTYTNSVDDSKETFDSGGRLVRITARNGQTQTLTRSTSATPASVAPGANYLIGVTDHFGRTLSFT